MATVFWLSLFLIVYPYGVYPLVLLLWGRLRPRPVARAAIEPGVTVLVPAYNEAACIASRTGVGVS